MPPFFCSSFSARPNPKYQDNATRVISALILVGPDSGELRPVSTMTRPKAKRTPAEARRHKRAMSQAAAYYASESKRQQPTPPVEEELNQASVPREDSCGEYDVDQPGPELEPEPNHHPEAGIEAEDSTKQRVECRAGRDLSDMDNFDWGAASKFAAHPAALAGISEREKKAFLCYNSPIMTRSLWDDFIKPLVDATVVDLVPAGLQTWELKSFKATRTQLKNLAPGMDPVFVDACRNHCCVYNTAVATRGEKCPHCKADRRDHEDKPVVTAAIFPLRNMLRAQLLDKNLRKSMMDYRSSYQQANGAIVGSCPEVIEDFWDGEEPRRMMKPGGPLASPTVIALTVTGDAAEYSKIPPESMTPYMALNQNLPPSIRYKNEMVLALHAGEAKDNSVWEAVFNFANENDDDTSGKLGLNTSLGLYYKEEEFTFQICMGTGDYPFAAACLGVCGQAGRCSCRICDAAGYRVEPGYYLVHEKPYDDEKQLEMAFPYKPIQYGHNAETVRTWDKYKTTIKLAGSIGVTAWKALRLETGISARSVPPLVRHLELTKVPFHRLIPIDPIHSMSLNVVKIMMQLVTGKDVNMVTCDFCLTDIAMKGFFDDLLACTKDIPEEIMKRPMVDFRKSSARSEHFVAIGRLAPILLAGRLPAKYMGAITQASYILDEMSRLRINQNSLECLEEKIISFQDEFYENWYGGMEFRARICKTYFHTIGHLSDAIKAWGPPFVFSQYAMERLNGRVIKMARANGKTPVASSSERLTREYRLQRILPDATAGIRRDPILGLRQRTSPDHRDFILTKVEKRALAAYLNTAPEQIPESVFRYTKFVFDYQLDFQKVASVLHRPSGTVKRECRYAYCSDLDSFCDVQSLCELRGEVELAFVKLIKMEKLSWDDYENEYLANWNSCWGSRIHVINCNDITNSVGFVQNSKYPLRRYLVRNLRVYNGDRYEEDSDDD